MLDTYRNHGSVKNACISKSSCLSKYFVIFRWTMIVDMKSHYYAGHTFIIIWQYDWMLREGSLNNSVCWSKKSPWTGVIIRHQPKQCTMIFGNSLKNCHTLGLFDPPPQIRCFWTWPNMSGIYPSHWKHSRQLWDLEGEPGLGSITRTLLGPRFMYIHPGRLMVGSPKNAPMNWKENHLNQSSREACSSC